MKNEFYSITREIFCDISKGWEDEKSVLTFPAKAMWYFQESGINLGLYTAKLLLKLIK